jgi:hypothetical protein
MVEDQPSVRLQDEVGARVPMSADPVVIYTRTLDEAREVHRLFSPLDRDRFATVDQAVSLFSFVPDPAQQARNAEILGPWRDELAALDPAPFPPEVRERREEGLRMMAARPFGLDDLPADYRAAFTHLPSARPENHGFLTFLYPVVDLWDGKQMLRFADEVETITTPAGRTYHAAGAPILFAKLARIVLHDGRATVASTAALLLLILLVDLRSLRKTLAALVPLGVGVLVMLGAMTLLDVKLNFMNIVVLPIILGYGVSHGVYLVHRYDEGASPWEAFRSVGLAIAASTLTTLAGWAALLAAPHRGLKSMGALACVGIVATLVVSFTLMMSVLQLMHERRRARTPEVP